MNPRTYVYKLVVDNGGAPCVTSDLLSLAICKPRIRSTAKPGDWIFGFGGKNYAERLIYVAKVDEVVENGDYYDDVAGHEYGTRADRIYRRTRSGDFEWRSDAKYHQHGREMGHDLGDPPEKGRLRVILSEHFWYFGQKEYEPREQRAYPAVRELVSAMRRDHRVNFNADVRQQLAELREALRVQYR